MSLNTILPDLLGINAETAFSPTEFFIRIFLSILLGFIIAVSYSYKSKYSKSFMLTLSTIPAIVAMIILMVNGNLGTGVAVSGAFSLVRFRSVPGTAKEIAAIFLSMGAGLGIGIGYNGYTFIFVLLVCIISLIFTFSGFGDKKVTERTVKVTVPEDLDYTVVFEDLFELYTVYYNLMDVKTSGMGSLFKLTYILELKSNSIEKEFIDELRCRNGNLEISFSKNAFIANEL